jgi:hypothetical protein
MSRIIHARIDADTEKVLVALERHLGWNDSKVVREGIKALNVLLVPKRKRKIAGLGKYRSGIPDLATNKSHMKGFGE